MRLFLVIQLLLVLIVGTFAQTPDSRGIYIGGTLEDVDMGWMNKIVVKEPSKPITQYGRTYTAAQTDAAQKIASWVQQTFVQRGLLGEIKLSLIGEPTTPMTSKAYNYNEAGKANKNALPNSYGAMAKFHYCISKTADKKFWPTPHHHCYMALHVMVNDLEQITSQVVILSSPDEYYFFLPKYDPDIKGMFESTELARLNKYRDFDRSPNLKNYEHYLLPKQGAALDVPSFIVVMTRDGKPLPFEQVTVGELIARIEAQFPMMQRIMTNDGTQRMAEVLQEAKRGFQVFKSKYRNQLNEYVYSPDPLLNIDLFNFAGVEEGKDVYWLRTSPNSSNEGGYATSNFPLLRLKKGVKQSLATGAPQWIIFKLHKPLNPGYGGDVQLFDNFISRFNYDYVYRYFFGRDKVTEPYTPLGAPPTEAKAATGASAELSATAKKKSDDKSVLYFEDFSGTPVGAAPKNWTTQRSTSSGEQPTVLKPANVEGTWLKLKRTAAPKNFPKSIAGDFELSCDLLVHKGDVPWGTPGIDMSLKFSGSAEKEITLNFSPGDMNRDKAAGWLTIDRLAGCKTGNYYSMSDFTGSKPVNKVTITLVKKGESILIRSNNEKLYECNTAFATGMSLTSLSFNVSEKNLFYISNIQIKKL